MIVDGICCCFDERRPRFIPPVCERGGRWCFLCDSVGPSGRPDARLTVLSALQP